MPYRGGFTCPRCAIDLVHTAVLLEDQYTLDEREGQTPPRRRFQWRPAEPPPVPASRQTGVVGTSEAPGPRSEPAPLEREPALEQELRRQIALLESDELGFLSAKLLSYSLFDLAEIVEKKPGGESEAEELRGLAQELRDLSFDR